MLNYKKESVRKIKMNLKEVMETNSSQSRIEAVFYTTQYRHLINMNMFSLLLFPCYH